MRGNVVCESQGISLAFLLVCRQIQPAVKISITTLDWHKTYHWQCLGPKNGVWGQKSCQDASLQINLHQFIGKNIRVAYEYNSGAVVADLRRRARHDKSRFLFVYLLNRPIDGDS